VSSPLGKELGPLVLARVLGRAHEEHVLHEVGQSVDRHLHTRGTSLRGETYSQEQRNIALTPAHYSQIPMAQP